MVKHMEHYCLHQWEPEGNLLRMDLNEDFAKIGSMIVAWGSCLQMVGTYTGDGNYEKGKATVLHFPSRPLAVTVVDGNYQTILSFLRSGAKGVANGTAGMGSVLSLARGEDSLSWHVTSWTSGGSTPGGISAEGQFNERGTYYTYLVSG